MEVVSSFKHSNNVDLKHTDVTDIRQYLEVIGVGLIVIIQLPTVWMGPMHC